MEMNSAGLSKGIEISKLATENVCLSALSSCNLKYNKQNSQKWKVISDTRRNFIRKRKGEPARY